MPKFESIDWVLGLIRKLPISFLLACLVTSGFAIFATGRVADALLLPSLRIHIQPYLSIAFFLLALFLIFRCFELISNKREQKLQREVLEGQFSSLSREDLAYLFALLKTDKSVIYFDIHDGVINNLFQRRIVARIGSNWSILEGIPHTLQPWAKEYLLKNQAILAPGIDYFNEKKGRILKSRGF